MKIRPKLHTVQYYDWDDVITYYYKDYPAISDLELLFFKHEYPAWNTTFTLPYDELDDLTEDDPIKIIGQVLRSEFSEEANFMMGH